MVKILFVCHGNICRSPMAEFIMEELVKDAVLSRNIAVASAATSREELGNPVYPPVRRLLNGLGIDCSRKTARQLKAADYEEYDYIVGMDGANLRNMLRLFGGDEAGKVSLLMDETDQPRDVADPWYTGDFEATLRDVKEGCGLLLQRICREQGLKSKS